MIDDMTIDDCVDRVIASCNDDMRGALKALMLVNEQLERELQRMSALVASPTTHAAGSALH